MIDTFSSFLHLTAAAQLVKAGEVRRGQERKGIAGRMWRLLKEGKQDWDSENYFSCRI